MTIYENMAFSLTLRKEDKQVIHRKVMAAAEILDLKTQPQQNPNSFRADSVRGVANGQSDSQKPQSIFYSTNRFPTSTLKLRGSMRRDNAFCIKSSKATMMYVTHDQTIEALDALRTG